MKKFFFLLMILPFVVTAQDVFEEEIIQEEPKFNYSQVMLIAFDPMMFFSDADHDLAKDNKKSVQQVRNIFRHRVDVHVKSSIISSYGVRPLLSDTAQDAWKDLENVYRSVRYHQAKSKSSRPVVATEAVTSTDKKPTLASRVAKITPRGSEAQGVSKYSDEPLTRDYINVEIRSVKMLEYLHEKYGTDLFVFINQVELITNYEHCLDRATNTFERTVKMHYSIFDVTGKQHAGDVAIVKFPSNSNDLFEIINKNLPVVGEYLAYDLPGQKRIRTKTDENPEEVAPVVESSEELLFVD